MNYFEDIASELTVDELRYLGFLLEQDATVPFKSLAKKKLEKFLNLTPANFRKLTLLLESKAFISIMRNQMSHSIYITSYGIEAITYSLKGVE